MDKLFDLTPTKKRVPEPHDHNKYILYVVDNSGDTQYDYVTDGWYFNGVWIVDDEICRDEVVAWMPYPSAKDCRNKIKNLKNTLIYNVGDIVSFTDDNGYNVNVLITEIDDDGTIKGLNEYLEEYCISKYEHIKITGTQIDVKSLIDVIKTAGCK